MDRAAAAVGLAVGAAAGRAHVQQAGVVGVVGADLAEPAGGGAVEADLVDRLPGADPAQLGRPIGGEDDQRARPPGRPRRPPDGGSPPPSRSCRRRAPGAPLGEGRARARRSRRERSSRTTLRSIPGSRSSARAIGVEREPGERTARATPQRASSSTRAEARAVLRLVVSIIGFAVARRASRSISTPRPGVGRGSIAGRRRPSSGGDIVGEQRRRRQPVGEAGGEPLAAAGPGPCGARPRCRAGCRARWRGRRGATAAIRSASRGPPTFASFSVAASQAPSVGCPLARRQPRRRSRRRRSGPVTAAAQRRPAPSSRRAGLLGELEPDARRARASSLDRLLDGSRRRSRRSRSFDSRRRRRRARRRIRSRSSPVPTLTLSVSKPALGQLARRSRATSAGSPAPSVPLQRTGRALSRLRAAARAGRPALGPSEVEQRDVERGAAPASGGGSAVQRGSRERADGRRCGSRRPATVRAAVELGDDLRPAPAPPRRLSGTASPQPVGAVLGVEPDEDHLAVLERPRSRSRTAPGTGARPGYVSQRCGDPHAPRRLRASRPTETSDARRRPAARRSRRARRSAPGRRCARGRRGAASAPAGALR